MTSKCVLILKPLIINNLYFLICSEVRTVAERLENKRISGMDLSDAHNELSVDLVHCAKVCKLNQLTQVII